LDGQGKGRTERLKEKKMDYRRIQSTHRQVTRAVLSSSSSSSSSSTKVPFIQTENSDKEEKVKRKAGQNNDTLT
jgi:hypothetical protein